MLPLLLAASLWAREADAQTVQPSVSFTKDDYPVYENAGTGTITVKLASTQPTSTTVRISATGNTAIAGDDYVSFENVDLTIPAGGLTASHTVQILQDNIFENGDGLEGEDFQVSVVSVNGVAPATAVETEVTIIDDEYTACFGSKTFLLEEDEGVYSLKLRLARALPFPVTATSTVVDYLTTEDVDYEVLKGTHTFKPWSQDGAFEIWIKDDKIDEPNELFRITANVASVPDGEVFCSTDIIIRDNDEGEHDGPPEEDLPIVTISGGPAVTEGDQSQFKILVDRAVTSRINVSYTVSKVKGDVVDPQFLTDRFAGILPNIEPKPLTVQTHNDNVYEPEGGLIKITLNPGTGYRVGDPSSVINKVNDNDDTLPIVTISGGPAVTEGDQSQFKILVDRAVTSRINVSYTVSKVKGDVVDPQFLTDRFAGILPNIEPKPLTVQTHNDNVYEPEGGLIKITLNPGTGYRVGDPSSVINKVNDNDDTLPIVTISGGPAVTEGDQSQFKILVDRAVTSRINVSYTVSKVKGDVVDPQFLTDRFAGILPNIEPKPLTVQTHNDNVYEPEGGLIKITLNPGTGYRVGDPSSVINKVNDNDEGNAFSHTCAAHPLSVNKSPLTILEDKRSVRVISYPENGRYFCTIGGMSTFVSIPPPAGVTGTFDFETTLGGSLDARDWNDDKLTGDRCGPVHPVGDHRYQLCVIDDENIPPATTEFKLLDGGRSISINEGQEATHKVIIGKPVAQTALPCFAWGKPEALRDVLFDRGKALDSNGCMKSWPGTPHVGNVIMDLYINTNDDDAVGADPRFNIGLKSTRKDGSAEPNAATQSVEVTVVNDDHSEVVVVEPHPAPSTWVEVKEFYDSIPSTDKDREFSDGTFCNAETPGTRTVTAPGGTGATRTCVKYFARHATHLKWTTGRGTNFNYDIWATRRGNTNSRVASIPAGSSYRSGKWPLPSDFRCNDAEARARSVTVTIRDTVGPGEVGAERSNPPIHGTSRSFRNCADQLPGREYSPAAELPQGVRSEPPPDVDQYPATEWAYPELQRDEIVVAESVPYVDIRNARKTKFVKEGRRARFFVELSGEAAQDVAVEWRVRPSVEHPRATLGEDVEKASGTLVIAQGETRGEIRVKTYEDSHDDDREKFRVRITSAEGAVIRQQRAHAIIRNDDPMPAAWLARFGRTVAEQALDGIAGRMAAPRTPGMAGTLAGRALGAGAGAWSEAEQGLGTGDGAGVAGRFDARPDRLGTGGFGHDTAGFGEPQSEPLTMRDALLGSRFTLTGPEDGSGGSLALWGRAAHGRFDGREGTFSLDGEATTALLGADYARGGRLVGLALAQSEGEGAYRDTKTALRPASQDCPGGAEDVLCGGAVREGDGTVEASLTAALPYASLEASERLTLWGALGYGEGEVTLATAMGGRYRADTTWRMAAAGLRGDLLEAPAEGSGPALALTTDALWARTASEKTLDLAASASDVTRLGLEGSWRMALDGGDAGAAPGASLVPKLELGARHDGGDAETGAGLELGGGLVWTDPALGLTLDVSGRTLIAHEDGALEDRGFAAALGFDPRPETERGPSFSLRQDFGGQATGGLDALFQSAPLDERSGSEAASRWTAEAAYGLPAFGGRYTASPHAGLGLSPDARDYTLGWRWTPARGAPDLAFGVKATRRESDGAAPEHALGFEASARW